MCKISVLMPTRSRFKLAKKSIDSLFDKSHSFENFEILIAIDKDDSESNNLLIDYLKDKPNVSFHLFDRHGYKGLNIYYNYLALKAVGSSLMLWNDDSIIESFNWDLEIINNHTSFCVLSPFVSNMDNFWRHQGVLYPIIPKKWIDITGEWSRVPACDSVIDLIAKRLNILKKLETVHIYHDRFDLSGYNFDQTYLDAKNERSHPDNYIKFNIGYPEVIEEHYLKLKAYIDSSK
jgi:hypothetical protein